MITLYVLGTSKAQINRRLAAGESIVGTEHRMLQTIRHVLNDETEECVVKVFEKYVDGTPYAKAYGTWKPAKQRVV